MKLVLMESMTSNFLNGSVRFDDAVQFCRSFFGPALLRGT